MHIAIEGCSHGELDIIYSCITHTQQRSGVKLDLLICCGDFQSVRNPGDLKCMAVPTKYMQMQSFYKYYSGEKKAPVLTIFIGGNHEASNYLQELPYGGWVAPDIYYLGYGGVINVGGLRIGGISGIYKGQDYLKGRYEIAPYNQSSIRSVYHVRNLEVFRMKQLSLSVPLDIFLSHDWPRGVTKFGDAAALCRQKKFFKEEVASDTLGSRAAQELLQHLGPRYWFSGHLHVKFAAIVKHEVPKGDKADITSNTSDSKDDSAKKDGVKNSGVLRKSGRLHHTRFLALDKCLPRREFLQILDIKPNCRRIKRINGEDKYSSLLNQSCKEGYDTYDSSGKVILYHDLEWLTILRLTNHLMKVTSHTVYMPGPGGSSERFDYTPTEADMAKTLQLFGNDLQIREDSFARTASPFNPVSDAQSLRNIETQEQPPAVLHPYTMDLCDRLSIDDPVAVLLGLGQNTNKRKSFMLTPKRPPAFAEMNITLNNSKMASPDDAPGSDDESDSGGDIVFEVSINSGSDGSARGFLSPAVTPSRSTNARKALQLSTPIHAAFLSSDSLSSQEEQQRPLAASSSIDSKSGGEGETDESAGESFTGADSAVESIDSSLPESSDNQKEGMDICEEEQRTMIGSLVLSAPKTTSPKRRCDEEDETIPKTPSPKRQLSQSENEATTQELPPQSRTEDDRDVAEATATTTAGSDEAMKVSRKPSKIRRRNADMYANNDDD